MKYIIICIFILVTTLLTAQVNHPVEDMLHACLLSSFSQEGVDMNTELDRFEHHLIERGVLSSNSGQAYHDFYNEIVINNDVQGDVDLDQFQLLFKLLPVDYNTDSCWQTLESLDSLVFVESKLYKLKKSYAALDSLQNISDKPLSNTAKTVISILSPDDFNIPYYRAIALLAILNTITPRYSGLLKRREPIAPKDYTGYDSVSFYINSNDEILYDGKIISMDNLEHTLYSFIREKQRHHVVILSVDGGASYSLYIDAHNAINGVYTKLRNEESNKLFGKAYSELSKEEKIKIRITYPRNVKEK